MSVDHPQKLKLLAKSGDELAMISCLLQDALLVTQDMVFDQSAKQFIAVFSRFMWENEAGDSGEVGDSGDPPVLDDPDKDARFEDVPSDAVTQHFRVHSALRLEGIQSAQQRNVPKDAKANLNLLSIKQSSQGIELLFSDAAAIRLQASEILVGLEDLGEPWPTLYKPNHV